MLSRILGCGVAVDAPINVAVVATTVMASKNSENVKFFMVGVFRSEVRDY
jgi:hypothetical protein